MGLTSKIPELIAELETRVREAELAGAEKVAESARERVPYDPTTRHHVRDAIHTEEADDGVYVIAGDKDAWYAHMIEHGTTHSAPHPFLVPALEENQTAIIADVQKAIREAT